MSTHPQKKNISPKDTSWQAVASWYDELLEEGTDTYQEKVIKPNLLRLLGDISGKKVLDLACGQGYFSRVMTVAGAKVVGVDLSPDLIALAKEQSPKEIEFKISSADKLTAIAGGIFDVVTCVLAIQNIEQMSSAFAECARVLKPSGRLFLVLNHPTFRIPKKSAWGVDEITCTQYRRIDAYMSESKTEIDMQPSNIGKKVTTVSFHRPLQVFFKALTKNGFTVTRLEEWMSHKQSEVGPKKAMEDRARKEFPLFMSLEAKKN
jgi:ubiquinone/menaquinone biosynthesis C-methylase UbiE